LLIASHFLDLGTTGAWVVLRMKYDPAAADRDGPRSGGGGFKKIRPRSESGSNLGLQLGDYPSKFWFGNQLISLDGSKASRLVYRGNVRG